MKAVIVLDIPVEGMLKTTNDLYEKLKGYKVKLVPLPSKQKPDDGDGWHEIDFKEGWNACLDEIIGEEE